MKKLFSIFVFSLLFTNILKADHVTKEGIFKDDPVYHNEKKIILSFFTSRIFLACIYKCLFFSNFDDHSAYRMSGQQQKIIQDELDLSLKVNKIDRNKYDINSLNQGLYLHFKKLI